MKSHQVLHGYYRPSIALIVGLVFCGIVTGLLLYAEYSHGNMITEFYPRIVIGLSIAYVLYLSIVYGIHRCSYINETISDEVYGDSEGYLKAVLNTVVDGIVTINRTGIIQSFNPAAERIFGYTEEDVLNKNVKMLMPDSYRKEHDGYLHHYLETGNAKVIGIGREVDAQRKDGSIFPMELGVSEMNDSDKHMFVGIIRDISERKKIGRASCRERVCLYV